MLRGGEQTSRWRPTVSGVVAVLALVISAFTLWHEYQRDEAARDSAARAARHDVVADILQMGEYDEDGGASNQGEILVLAGDAAQLIDDFGQERLRLSAMAYRKLAEYVTYSTREAGFARRLVDYLLDAAEPGSNEHVFAHRVLGDLAAQSLEPDELEREYEAAFRLNKDFREREPQLGREVDDYTTAHRLLSAYIGASLSRDLPSVHAAFCELADRWQGDRALVQQLARNDRIDGQLRRLDARDLTRLDDVCVQGTGEVTDQPP